MKKNMFKVMALSLAMATLSTTAAFAAGWGKVGSEWYYYQEDGTVARIPGSTLWSATMNPANLPIRQAIRILRPKRARPCCVLLGTGKWHYGCQLLGSRRRCMVSCGCKGLILKDQVYNENKDMYYLGKDGRMVTIPGIRMRKAVVLLCREWQGS